MPLFYAYGNSFAVLPDDVAFIREVHEGQVLAPEMDPGVELYKLKKKFDVWKREFKEKLRTTGNILPFVLAHAFKCWCFS